MTRWSYVNDVWLPENGPWLVLACSIIGCATAPEASGFVGNVVAWLGASVAWFLACLFLVGALWRPWGELAPERREPPVYDAPPAEAPPSSGRSCPCARRRRRRRVCTERGPLSGRQKTNR